MHEWFAGHAPDLAYEAYFSNCDAGGVQSQPVPHGFRMCQEPGFGRGLSNAVRRLTFVKTGAWSVLTRDV